MAGGCGMYVWSIGGRGRIAGVGGCHGPHGGKPESKLYEDLITTPICLVDDRYNLPLGQYKIHLVWSISYA